MLEDEDQHRDPIGCAAEDDLECIHLVNVGHAEGGEHGEDHDAHAASEVAAVDPDQQLEKSRCGQSPEPRIRAGLRIAFREPRSGNE